MNVYVNISVRKGLNDSVSVQAMGKVVCLACRIFINILNSSWMIEKVDTYSGMYVNMMH